MRRHLLAACALLCACRKDAPSSETKPPPTTTTTTQASTSKPGIAKPEEPPTPASFTHGPHVEVLYRGSTDLRGAGLIGVSPEKKQAVVQGGTGICKTANDCGPAGHRFETVDWGAGKVIDRWQTDPMFDCPKVDVTTMKTELRYARLVHDLGSKVGAVSPGPKFQLTPDGKRMVYTTCGDKRRLMVAASDGTGPKEIVVDRAPDLDRIAISPDGRRITWTFLGGVPQYPHGEGPSGPRQAGVLFVAELDTLGVKKVPMADAELYFPTFTRDGSRVLLVAQREKSTCVAAADAQTLDAIRMVHCPDATMGTGYLAQSPNGELVLFSTVTAMDAHFVLLEASTGKVRADRRRKVSYREDTIVSDAGVAVFNDKGGLVLLDLVAGKEVVLQAGAGWYKGIKTTRFFPDGRLFAINYAYPTVDYQLVAIDVTAALAAKP